MIDKVFVKKEQTKKSDFTQFAVARSSANTMLFLPAGMK